MVWTRYQFAVAVVSISTCASNTLFVKWADRNYSPGKDGKSRVFHHPFFLTSLVFFGEVFNLLWFRILYIHYKRKGGDEAVEGHKLVRGNRNYNPLIVAIPALCELGSSSITFIGLSMTYASSYQMLKTSVIIFTAILSIIFLHKKIKAREWLGIGIVIGGLLFVALGDYYVPKSTPKAYKTKDIIIGDVLIVSAQVITATQMVTEERLVSGKDIQPLEAIGWEGIFGFLMMLVFHVVFYWIPCPEPIAINSRQTLEDGVEALVQIGNNTELLAAIILFLVTIMICKVAGINLTKEFSAVTRRVFDSLRMVILYGFGIGLFGQRFHFLHPLGFFFIVFGVLLHNNAINMNTFRYLKQKCGCSKRPEGENNEKGEASQLETSK